MADQLQKTHGVVAPSKRYRLRPGQFNFKLVNGKLVEVNTGVFAVHRATSTIFNQKPKVGANRPTGTIYLHDDGSPADPITYFMLRQGTNDYLSFLTCRIAPDITEDSAGSEAEYWNEILEKEGMPEDIVLSSPGGVDANRLEEIDAARYENLHHRRTRLRPEERRSRMRPIQGIPPSEWCRFVTRRLSLFFRRLPTDPLVLLMAGYFCRTRRWNDWHDDPALEPLVRQWHEDDRLQRLVDIIERYAYWRGGIAQGRRIEREPTRFTVSNRHGRFSFSFPSPIGRRGATVERGKEVRAALWMSAVRLISGRWFSKASLAAAVYLGQTYIEKPSRFVGRRLSQNTTARAFGVTRRQLTHALKDMRERGRRGKAFFPAALRRDASA